jgi:protein-S-isoprenylcysteine O-methyltransferase Ste14
MQFYPPLMVLTGIIAQIVLGQFSHVAANIASSWQLVGAALVILSLACIVLISRSFNKEETTILPDGTPSALMQSGFFAYSRNPIYVCMTLLLIGAGLLSGTYWSLVVPVVFVLAVQQVWIIKEEENMEASFGQHYRDYKQRVRRWL